MFDFWETDLTEEERNRLLDNAAEQVRKRRLEVPAVAFLELHKPMAGVAGAAGVVMAPFLVPLLGFSAVNDYSRLFSKRENIEDLMKRLEAPREGSPES
jgi:hypothetical protein